MKKLLIALCGGAILWVGCKEHNPPIVFTSSADSIFTVSPVPSAAGHNVLIEEFTGQSCSNCPAAHSSLEALAAANPGRVNIIGLYLFNIPQALPPNGAKNDLRDSVAFNVGNQVFGGVGQLPSGGVDRVAVGGKLVLDQGTWGGLTTSQLSITDPLNLDVQSVYNSTTNEATITATIIYTQTVTTPQNISVVVVEDSIVDFQEYSPFDPIYHGMDSAYVFTNVFRGMVSSPPFGDPIVASKPTKDPGLAYQIRYKYKPKTLGGSNQAINPVHCRVIAFVNSNNGSDYHIVQSAQTKLVP